MDQSVEDFFQSFRSDLSIGAASNQRFALTEFVESLGAELVESGFVEGFEHCHYRASRGARVDGYWFAEDDVLDLYIADFDARAELASLPKTDVDAAFKRLTKFFEASKDKDLAAELEPMSPEYGLAREIADRSTRIRKINLVLLSERVLSERIQSIDDSTIAGVPASFHIWDITRLQRQRSARGQKEPLDLDVSGMFGRGLSCLPAHLDTDGYMAYLIVVPGDVLASLYEKYGARLLEQNVRTFLQARAGVNKGIRASIMNEPEMFFAYNNGVTATAQSVETSIVDGQLTITRLLNLQIVNGGQTTASLFHARKKDKADLSKISVQMKLSVIDGSGAEAIVPKISQYANTQNKVNDADFFSNHPFHVRMETFSRRIWVPAGNGSQKETKCFYERARGQYADAQSALTAAEQRRFLLEYPKHQMFTKTDLAKFENVWEDHPSWVNRGAQKNFAQFAKRIGEEWTRSADEFSEFYYKRAIARALIFKSTEQLVSEQAWYSGGYRANIVAYALALLSEIAKQRQQSVDFQKIWKSQKIENALLDGIAVIAKFVHSDLVQPPAGISNVTEWCKRVDCWTRLLTGQATVEKMLSAEFWQSLVPLDTQKEELQGARRIQKIDDGLEAQRRVIAVHVAEWSRVLSVLKSKGQLTSKDRDLLNIAMQIPSKVPSGKQCIALLEIVERARLEGVVVAA
ncbi:AIPR family protein [Diaphorobacter sp. HDW4B]|uniref:AIPR family protein n=1 Tax=Diaphorobacter sp. HDW4B TaxID=2714925 RepID=UPI00140DED76|nr:AIPR family protein [Diaphorobacter sp. HDW4B]QIL69089.1 AIPR family protein [Diaphorobacter sp. HDW4B]